MIINKNTLYKKDETYRKKAKKNAVKTLTKPKLSRTKLKRKADKQLKEIIDNSDAETIQYAENLRYKEKKLKIKNFLRYKRRKATVDPPSDAETIAYTEPIQPTDYELTLLWTDEKAGKKRKKREK